MVNHGESWWIYWTSNLWTRLWSTWIADRPSVRWRLFRGLQSFSHQPSQAMESALTSALLKEMAKFCKETSQVLVQKYDMILIYNHIYIYGMTLSFHIVLSFFSLETSLWLVEVAMLGSCFARRRQPTPEWWQLPPGPCLRVTRSVAAGMLVEILKKHNSFKHLIYGYMLDIGVKYPDIGGCWWKSIWLWINTYENTHFY